MSGIYGACLTLRFGPATSETRAVTAAFGLKRFAIAGGAIVAALFVTLMVFPFFVPAATVRDAVKTEIHAVTGLDPTLRGGVSVSLFPHPSVTFRDVLLAHDGSTEPVAAADELTARLRYFPLLAGRIEIADVTLNRPTINVTLLPDGRSNWSGLAAALAHALEPNPNRSASFSEIGVHDGTVVVHDSQKRLTQQFDDVEFQVAWPSISRTFAANGQFTWRDQPVDASLTLSDFQAALAGQRSGVKLRLSSKPLNVAFDGAASNRPTLKIEGMLNLDSPSLREALSWTNNSKVPFGGFERFALRAQSNIENGIASLTKVNVEIDGNRAEGSLTLATDGHRGVQGTLASDSLDLTPYVSAARLMPANERSWDRVPIAMDGLGDFNVDLRLSAASIKIGGAQLGRTAVSAVMHDGKLNVTVGESQSFGGVATGSFGLGNANGGIEVSSHLRFDNIDLAACLGQIFGVHKLQGRGTLMVDIGGSGASIWALTRTLNGTAGLNAHDGTLDGINVEQVLRQLERRPLSGGGSLHSGRTQFDQLVLNAKIEQGIVSIADLHLSGPAARVAMSGQASIPARDLDLEGKATLVSTETANEFELPFTVGGSWDEPRILPDASILLRRSGAAAPLIDAVKQHSAGEAVRKVIDQIFATTPGGAAPPPTAPAAGTTPATAVTVTAPAGTAAPSPR
jgi:AsmA protein